MVMHRLLRLLKKICCVIAEPAEIHNGALIMGARRRSADVF